MSDRGEAKGAVSTAAELLELVSQHSNELCLSIEGIQTRAMALANEARDALRALNRALEVAGRDLLPGTNPALLDVDNVTYRLADSHLTAQTVHTVCEELLAETKSIYESI